MRFLHSSLLIIVFIRGCEYGFVGYPFWVSSEANGAATLRPELCPLGKYGYDARCRGWYHNGKKKALDGNGTLHITAPYVFAGGKGITGQSTSSPIMDGETHIGQAIVGEYSFIRRMNCIQPFLTDNNHFQISFLRQYLDHWRKHHRSLVTGLFR